MVDLIKVIHIKNHCNKYFLNAGIFKVFPFETEVGQECYY